MRRREFLAAGATATLITSTNVLPITRTRVFGDPGLKGPKNLTPPADGPIPVAFALSRGATMIDFAGPWEVFQDVMIPASKAPASQQGHAQHRMGFNLYTVSEKIEPIEASAGMKIVPDYTFENAPDPKVVVIPAQAGP